MITLLSMPQDRAKADQIADAMVAEDLPVWAETATPGGEGWAEALSNAQSAKCLVVCWSEAALGDTDEAAAFRDAAMNACAQGRTIGVLLDPVTPPEGFVCAIYDLSDWRLAPSGLRKMLIGKAFLRDVVVAAKYKQANRDPAPPSAPTKLLVRQIAVFSSAVLVPFIAILGSAETIFNVRDRLASQPSEAEEVAWQALPAGDCKALRGFVREFGDGAYRDRADTMLAAAETRSSTVWEPQVFDEEIYLAHSTGARAGDAEAEGKRRCEMLIQGTEARNLKVSIERVRQDCQSIGGERLCDWRGTASCNFEVATKAEQEVCNP